MYICSLFLLSLHLITSGAFAVSVQIRVHIRIEHGMHHKIPDKSGRTWLLSDKHIHTTVFFVKADIRSKIIIVPSKQQNLSSLSLFYKLLLKKGVQPSGESPGTHLAFPALVFIVATIRSLCLLNSRHHLTTEVSGLRWGIGNCSTEHCSTKLSSPTQVKCLPTAFELE